MAGRYLDVVIEARRTRCWLSGDTATTYGGGLMPATIMKNQGL
jgi:hypothetical protein